MSKIGMDLSQYKKVSSGHDTTTLKHPDGHSITLAHHHLSPKVRGQLAALPMHPEPKQSNPKLEESKKTPPKMAQGGADPTQQHLMPGDKIPNAIEKKVVSQAKHKMADGGEVGYSGTLKEGYPDDQKNNLSSPDDEERYPPADESQRMSVKPLPKKMADGGAISPNQVIEPMDQAQDEEDSPAPVPAAPIATPANTTLAAQEAAPAVQQAAAQDTGVPPPVENPIANGQNLMQAGLEAGVKGAEAQQVATQTLGAGKEQAAKQANIALQDTANRYQSDYNDNMKHFGSVAQDALDSHINPTQYMENAGALGKVGTAIGLIQGALGRNHSITDFLNTQIDRDVAAQQANLGQKNNILAAYQHQFGNMRDSLDAAKLAQVAIYGAQMDKAAAAAATPQAAADLQNGKAKLFLDHAGELQNFTMNRMMAQTAQKGGDPAAILPMARLMKPEYAKTIEQMIMPGTGPSTPSNPQGNEISQTGPIPEPVKQEITAKTNLIKSTQNLRQFVADHGGIDKLNPADRAQATTLAGELQGLYRKGVGASTSEGEQKTIDTITGTNPLGLLNMLNTSPKLKALEDSMGSSLNTVRRLNGLPEHPTSLIKEQSFTPQQANMLKLARQNPSHPNAALIFKKLGVQQ